MKNLIILIVLSVLSFSSCQKDTTTQPNIPPEEDFSYPPSSRFAVSLITNTTTTNVGKEIDVKLVYYNVQEVFGTAIEILYDNNLVSIPSQSKLLIGPFFDTRDTSKILILKKVENLFGRVNSGISYVRNSNLISSGSGVVLKLKFTALAKGNTWIKVNKNKLEIRKSDGNFINNFSNIAIDSLYVSIQ